MAFRRLLASPGEADTDHETAPDYDVMVLKRSSDHPLLSPLYARKAEIQQAMQGKERERARLAEALTALEARQAEDIAALGSAWNPVEYRKAKQDRDEADAELRMLAGGLAALEEKIDALQAPVRDDIERRLQALRRPHLAAMIAALRMLLPDNHALHSIEARSASLLGYGHYHLYNAGLPSWVQQLERSLAVIDRALKGPDAA